MCPVTDDVELYVSHVYMHTDNSILHSFFYSKKSSSIYLPTFWASVLTTDYWQKQRLMATAFPPTKARMQLWNPKTYTFPANMQYVGTAQLLLAFSEFRNQSLQYTALDENLLGTFLRQWELATPQVWGTAHQTCRAFSNVYWKYQSAQVTCISVTQCHCRDFVAFVVNASLLWKGVCREHAIQVVPMMMPLCVSGLIGSCTSGFSGAP